MEKTYDEWLKKQNRRWKGKRFRKHLNANDLARLHEKALAHLQEHGH